jgi:hypothetical protein
MTGSSPSWSSQAARCVSRGCSRSRAAAAAVPDRLVAVRVVTGGPGQAAAARRRREVQHPVRAQPPGHLDREVFQLPGQPGHVVPGVEDDQHVRVAGAPVPGGGQRGDDLADLGGGDLRFIVIGAEPDRIQHRRPAGPAGFQRGGEGVRPARDHLRVALAAPVHVAEHPLRAGDRARPQPVAHIGCQPDPPVRPGRQGQRRQRPAQPREIDPAGLNRVIGRAVPAAVLRLQRQRRQRPHRPICAQHRIGQSGQRIGPRHQAPEELAAEGRQHATGLISARRALHPRLEPRPTERHGHRLILKFCGRNPKMMTRWPSAITVTRRTNQQNP